MSATYCAAFPPVHGKPDCPCKRLHQLEMVFASHVFEFLAHAGLLDHGPKVRPMYFPDWFIAYAKPSEQYEDAGLEAHHIVATALTAIGREMRPSPPHGPERAGGRAGARGEQGRPYPCRSIARRAWPRRQSRPGPVPELDSSQRNARHREITLILNILSVRGPQSSMNALEHFKVDVNRKC